MLTSCGVHPIGVDSGLPYVVHMLRMSCLLCLLCLHIPVDCVHVVHEAYEKWDGSDTVCFHVHMSHDVSVASW